MDSERKPLMARNGLSRLPMLGSRLKPLQVSKRAHSPDDEAMGCNKKSRITEPEPFNDSIISLRSSTSSLQSSHSSTSLSQPAPNKSKSVTNQQSKPNLRASRKGVIAKTTALRRPIGTSLKQSSSRLPTQSGNAGNLQSSSQSASSRPVPSCTGASVPADGRKKRPAWDLKGRLQDMEVVLSQREANTHSLQSQLESYNQRIMQLEMQKQQLSGDVAKRAELSEVVSRENEELQKNLRECQEKMELMYKKMQQDIEDLRFTKSNLERQQAALEGEVTASRTENTGLKATMAQLTTLQARITAELDTTKLSLTQAFRDIRARDEEICHLKELLAKRDSMIEENNKKFREHETIRRKLHNTIQELKGNIRVFCRVRPLLANELFSSDGIIHHMNFPDPEHRVLELDRLSEMSMNESTLSMTKRGNNNKYEFCFDRVFQPESTQAEIFDEISQLVQSALDGYNVCIFAYGQTGSGKTYTMEGSDDPESRGMIPRAVNQVFQAAVDLEDKGWKYQFSSSFLEIYNETIRDLLGNPKDDVKHEIKMVGKASDSVIVTNLTVVTVTTEEQVHKLLHKAGHNRAVAETRCNEHSSRSHSVFQLHISGSNCITSETCQGTLNLVDLAGSERLKESGSEGQRLKETQAINKSLSNLGNVIMALGNKESYIPYRNSKLTYLLQNSLGGNSKTLMFVNVSPKEDNFSETLNSLRFATKVNQCNIGTAHKKSK